MDGCSLVGFILQDVGSFAILPTFLPTFLLTSSLAGKLYIYICNFQLGNKLAIPLIQQRSKIYPNIAHSSQIIQCKTCFEVVLLCDLQCNLVLAHYHLLKIISQ